MKVHAVLLLVTCLTILYIPSYSFITPVIPLKSTLKRSLTTKSRRFNGERRLNNYPRRLNMRLNMHDPDTLHFISSLITADAVNSVNLAVNSAVSSVNAVEATTAAATQSTDTLTIANVFSRIFFAAGVIATCVKFGTIAKDLPNADELNGVVTRPPPSPPSPKVSEGLNKTSDRTSDSVAKVAAAKKVEKDAAEKAATEKEKEVNAAKAAKAKLDAEEKVRKAKEEEAKKRAKEEAERNEKEEAVRAAKEEADKKAVAARKTKVTDAEKIAAQRNADMSAAKEQAAKVAMKKEAENAAKRLEKVVKEAEKVEVAQGKDEVGKEVVAKGRGKKGRIKKRVVFVAAGVAAAGWKWGKVLL